MARNLGSCVVMCVGTFAALVVTRPSRADLIPNGNPTGAAKLVGANGGGVMLNPSPALYRIAGDCPWLLPALAAEGLSAANGWTINLLPLQGSITLNYYEAWVDTEPAINLNGLVAPAEANPGYGGANIGLTYTAKGTDPTGNGVGWIQVIHTNWPNPFGVANGQDAGFGYFNYIDNGWAGQTNPPSDPFYGATFSGGNAAGKGYLANSTTFVDTPGRELTSGADWQAQVFVATGNKANKTLNIYDGVWWGFQVTPEPSSVVLLITTLVVLALTCMRHRHKLSLARRV